MSDAYIIRRGGSGGEGFDPNGAVLKVVTSTNCTVLVTGTGYSKTHQQADGFPRSGDANVTEHFFSIPASAFGTITVKATNTYGDNTKTLTVNTAGKSYELLCGGINIILNSTFGLQSGYTVNPSSLAYSDRDKKITGNYNLNADTLLFNESTPVSAYSELTVYASPGSGMASWSIALKDTDGVELARAGYSGTGGETSSISGTYYPVAKLYVYGLIKEIREIVLS